MQTEEQIIWNIIDTINETRSNQDNNINERLIRSFLTQYRAALIDKYSMNGQLLADECFQFFKTETFNYIRPKQFTADLPKIIRLRESAGIYFEKNGEVIPIVNSESFSLSLKNLITGSLPKAKILSQKATIFIGNQQPTSCGGSTNSENMIINDFITEIGETANTSITVDVFAVLQNPSDAVDYDWTTSVYPFPAELIPDLKKMILQQEFNIILQSEVDNVTDGEDNKQKN